MVNLFLTKVKTVQWGKKFSQHKVLGQLDIHMQKNAVGLLPMSYTKINFKMDHRLKCKS